MKSLLVSFAIMLVATLFVWAINGSPIVIKRDSNKNLCVTKNLFGETEMIKGNPFMAQTRYYDKNSDGAIDIKLVIVPSRWGYFTSNKKITSDDQREFTLFVKN